MMYPFVMTLSLGLAGVLFEAQRSPLWIAAGCSLLAQVVDALHRRSQAASSAKINA